MAGLSKTTKSIAKAQALAGREWVLMDAQGRTVGRLAAEIARVLRGKDKPCFAPHVDTGDFVVVINAAGMRLTGAKASKKIYYRHSGYPGSIRAIPAGELMAKTPERVLRLAVEGMLPKNRLGRRLITKLKIYRGPEHPHESQRPRPYRAA